MKLLDVNVWLAATWARHRHHGTAKRWLDDEDDDVAMCRVTQMALLRLVTNPAVVERDALDPPPSLGSGRTIDDRSTCRVLDGAGRVGTDMGDVLEA